MSSYLSDGIRSIKIHENNNNAWSLQAKSKCIHTFGSYAGRSKRPYKTCRFWCHRKHLPVDSVFSDIQGSATVEASVVLPLFILAMLIIVEMCGCIRTRHAVYEGLQETAQYLAEYEYLYHMIEKGVKINMDEGLTGAAINTVLATGKLQNYIDDSELIEKYVSGGMTGLLITKAEYDAQDGFVYIELQYRMKANVALFGELEWDVHERIRQKAYLGYQDDMQSEEEIQYVYITENASVYHTSRSCYHISLSIRQISNTELGAIQNSVSPCGICTKYHTDKGKIYVTDEGDHYHTSLGCSGLKRTVYRVKARDYPYLPACSNCG